MTLSSTVLNLDDKMNKTPRFEVLAVTPLNKHKLYKKKLSTSSRIKITLTQDISRVNKVRDEITRKTRVVVVDETFQDFIKPIDDIRQSQPNILFILVYDKTELNRPEWADDIVSISLDGIDFAHHIEQIVDDNLLKYLRENVSPPVRSFAKSILNNL